jgi:transposase
MKALDMMLEQDVNLLCGPKCSRGGEHEALRWGSRSGDWSWADGASSRVDHAHVGTVARWGVTDLVPFRGSFLEYTQARGFVVDPTRRRRPTDKARVERAVRDVHDDCFGGESVLDIEAAH